MNVAEQCAAFCKRVLGSFSGPFSASKCCFLSPVFVVFFSFLVGPLYGDDLAGRKHRRGCAKW